MNLVKPGDWLVFFSGLLGVAWLFAALWQGGTGERLVIRSHGTVIAETSLLHDQTYRVTGPLGTSLITVQNRRARVAADPSPRQYCVKQGWLSQAGEAAICLPNQVSIEITGAGKLYDSLNY